MYHLLQRVSPKYWSQSTAIWLCTFIMW